MKNLRHMLRPTQWFGSSKRRQRPHAKPSNQRRLRSETLEKRELLAGDILASDFRPDVNPHHNGLAAVDTNADGWVTPGDILVVLNALAEQSGAGGAALGEADSDTEFKVDVNNDLAFSPADALMVINDLNENGPHAAGEIVKFSLTARDLNDDLLPTDASGNVQVDVNELFQLEVGYNDLRGLGAAGVFTQFFNLQTEAGRGGILTPAMTEFQELGFDQVLNDNTVTGDYVFSIEGQSTTYTVSRAAMAGNATGEVGNALEAFGYDPSDFDVKLVLPTSGTAPFRLQIRYTDFEDPAFRNVDLPNISVADNLSVNGDVTPFNVSPVNADGSINGNAVPFNIDFSNRFFNNQDLYGFNPEGDFNSTDGYIAVGASLLGASLSVPEKTGQPLPTGEPMESFSVRVFVDQAISVADPLDVNIEIPDPNTEKNEYLLMFREQGRIDESLVILDADATVSIVTNQTVVNTDPVVASALTISVAEDAASTTLNLLQGATDADGDTLVVQSPVVVSGNPVGTSVSGSTLTIDPSVYTSLLNEGQSEVIVYNYTISDGRGGTVAQTATVTITGKNDANTAPTTSPFTRTFTEDDAPSVVDLLTGATDADGDTMTVSNVQLTSAASTAAGITIDAANSQLNVTPQTYGALNTGESVSATYTYTISDGNGGTTTGNATVTITGITDVTANTDPVLATVPLTASFGEDDASGTVNLLQGASDADGDTLNASGYTLISGNAAGVVQAGNSLTVTPSAYNSLAQGTAEQVVATYNVIDGNGGSVGQTVTVTITGANDAPSVAAALTQTVNESDATTTLDLLTGATDPDTDDVLAVSNPSSSGDNAGVMVSGNTLSIDPSAYASLNTGETATAVISYQIIDGNGGSVNQTATITINGEGTVGGNNAPTVSGAITDTFTEDDATQTVDLLAGAADADGDTLSVTGLTVTGDTTGATVNGSTVTITPTSYSALNTGESAQIVYSYTISDGNGGTVAQTATITITGITDVTNSAPVVSAPVTATFHEDGANGTVDLLTGASDADSDTLTAQNIAVTSGDAAGIVVSGNTLTVTPSAYGSLNTGETAVITYSYVISDGNGGTVNQTATITITGADEVVGQGSTVKGQLFMDHPVFVDGLAQPGDGTKQDNESAFAGVVVRLTPANGIERSTTTDLQGNYSFLNVPPGAYSIAYDLPSSVLTTGAASSTGTIPAGDSTTVTGPSLGTVAIQGAISNLDILASSYLTANQSTSAASDGGLQGGSALLDTAGNQELFIAGLGLDGVKFAEIALNAERDAALLTVLEDDGDILTARLRRDQFLVSADGTAVQFFGGMEDFDFAASTNDLLTQEFATYRNAIDQVLAQQGA